MISNNSDHDTFDADLIEPLVRMQVQVLDSQKKWLHEMAKKYHTPQAAVLRAVLDFAIKNYEITFKEN